MKPPRISFHARAVAGLLVFGVTLSCRADTIQLNSGQEVNATITKYRNHNFEVRTDDGKTGTYPANNVKRIQFNTRSSPAKLTTRTNGVQEGTVSQFENGAFKMTQPGGERTFSAIFVEQAEFVPNRGQSSEVITHGQQVDIKNHLAPGNITNIDYYADWCGPCKVVSPTLEQLAKTDAEIALRKVDIVDWGSAVARQYNVTTLPRVEIYGRTGQLIGTVRGADPDQVKKYVALAKGR
jgi:thiol-disulfide isomerase/thioredoxin